MNTTKPIITLYAQDGEYYRPITEVIEYQASEKAIVSMAHGFPTQRTFQAGEIVAAEDIDLRSTPHVGMVTGPWPRIEAYCFGCGRSLSVHDTKESAIRALREHRAGLGLADHPKTIIT